MSEKTYRIGEAAAKLHLKTYVLRFWEMEFNQIAPLRTEKGQRLYTERDVALLRRIRYLLHERGLTIEGARRILREEAARGVEYRDAELALEDDGDLSLIDDDSAAPGPEEKAREEAGEGARKETGEDADAPQPGAEETLCRAVPLQASLFAPREREGKGLSPAETARLAADLMTIHHLLTAGFSGDAP